MSFVKRPGVWTVAFLLVLLSLVFLRTHGWRLPVNLATLFRPARPRVQTPEDTVYGMLDAARAGNTTVYVDTFAGPLQQQIEQAVRESGKAQFATYLSAQSSSFQSVAL